MSNSNTPYTTTSRWGETADTYKNHVSRITYSGAWSLISMANKTLPITKQSRILDNGTGSGAIALQIAEAKTGAHITAADVNQGMLDTFQSSKDENITTVIANAHTLSSTFPADKFSHVFCSFVLHVAPPPLKCLEEMHKVLRPDGVVGVAVWSERQDYMDIWVKACRSFDADYKLPQIVDDADPWRSEAKVRDGLVAAGFRDVQTRDTLMPYVCPSAEMFADFWFGKLGGNPVAEVLRKSWKGDLDALRKEVERIVREEYGDGSFITASAALGVGRK